MSPRKTRREQVLESRNENVPLVKDEETTLVQASTELVLGSIRFEADAENPRFLRFHDAVLARAETNANRDALDEEGIQELAATIAGTPVDLEHDPKKNIGFYTAGRAENGALKVDGVLWLDRCDALGISPAEIEDGTYKLSIEAEANTATCSICNTTHTGVASYCQHLKNKMIYKATRFLKGLRAVGGAITKNPAGSETVFSGLYFVASHQLDDPQVDETELEGAIEKREDVSDADKKRAESEAHHFADPVNKKYKLDSEEEVRAAWSYINMPKNASKYSPEDVKAIKSRIKKAGKKYGIEYADDDKKNQAKESIMDKEELKETPEEEKKESPEEEKKEVENKTEACDDLNMQKPEMKADDYAEMSKKVEAMAAELEANKIELQKTQEAKASVETKYAELEAQVTAITASLDEARNTIKAHKITELKSRLVGSVMDEKEFETRTDELLGLPDAALELLARVNQKSTVAPKPEENRIAAAEIVPDNGKVRIVL